MLPTENQAFDSTGTRPTTSTTSTTSTTTTTTAPARSFPHFLQGHRQGKAAWVFIGKRGLASFSGRSEHVDRILHDGTYHLQCEGEKIWQVRPNWAYRKESQPPRAGNSEDGTGSDALPNDSAWRTAKRQVIVCRPGDLLLINTRLWAHQTTIPNILDTLKTEIQPPHMSISIARDFYLNATQSMESGGGGLGTSSSSSSSSGSNKRKHREAEEYEMGNVDALFSSRSIAKGEVVFTEAEFAAVATSGAGLAMCAPKDANCDVVRLNGAVVIVALKNIQHDDIIMLGDPNFEEEEGDTESCKKLKK